MGLQPAVVRLGGKKVLLMETQRILTVSSSAAFDKTIMVQSRKIKREKQFSDTKRIFQEVHLAVFILCFNILFLERPILEKDRCSLSI